MRRIEQRLALWAVIGSFACGSAAIAADGGFGRLRGLGPKSADEAAAPVVQASAKILPADKNHPKPRLQVTAKIQSGWHIYSITQKEGGPTPSKIKVGESPSYKVGDFKAITEPTRHAEPAFDGLIVEEHEGEAVWEAPLTVTGAGALQISGAVNAQACKESCLPPTDYKFEVSGGGAKQADEEPAVESEPAVGERSPAEPPAAEAAPAPVAPKLPGVFEFCHDASHATLEGRLEPESIAPGGVARLTIVTTPQPPYHLYAYAEQPSDEIGRGKPTLIEIEPSDVLSFEPPLVSSAPISHPTTHPDLVVERFYSGAVTWTIEIHAPEGAAPGEYPIAGVVSYQTCKSGAKNASCDPPCGAKFRTVLKIGAAGGDAGLVAFEPTRYNASPNAPAERPVAAAKPAPEQPKMPAAVAAPGPASLATILGLGLLGGLILNLMPCVLPVIGLKLLSFASQAGQSRGRVLALNLWYTAGVLTVFMALATLAAGASLKISDRNLGWGEHFSSPVFVVVMSGLVFSMALSFLGIWEIPIPGFVGSGKGTELAAQEGPSGAFFKGVMSTILATPCSGPFLGTVFGFTLMQSPLVIYLVYGSIGLGMASPYLLIGAFPALVGWLPKPGAWMETFKQLMGFVLLATVIYLLSVLNDRYWVATLTLLLGLGVACWWIGRTLLYESLSKRLIAWGQGGAMALAIGLFAFSVLLPHKALLTWQPFTAERTTQLAAAGKTVMVEFTASWCPTCQVNMKWAIDTEATRKLIEANGIVPLLADWSDWSDEIRQALLALNHKEIPVLAIFPAGRPEEPIVLAGVISQAELLEALKQAGPSLANPPAAPADEQVSAVEAGR